MVKISRIHRLLKLITLLQTGKHYSSKDLAGILKVSRRTLFRDLNMLKLAGIPLLFDSSVRSYAIEKDFFLPPINFSLSEALGLMMLVQKYSSRVALPNFEQIASAMSKIESTLPQDLQEHCGSALSTLEVRQAPMSDAGRTKKSFELLWQASQKQESLDITYESYYEKRDIETRLDPYRMVFISRAWYVVGYSSMHREVRTFKLERIITITPTGKHFRINRKFNMVDYFGNAWRMIRGDRRHKIRIRFSPKVAGNVEEVLWHPTQQTSALDDGAMLYEVEVDGLNEISWWILGYGKEAVVESPAALRKIIHEHVKTMADAYNDS